MVAEITIGINEVIFPDQRSHGFGKRFRIIRFIDHLPQSVIKPVENLFDFQVFDRMKVRGQTK